MVVGTFKPKLKTNYLVIALAIVFVLYHLWQAVIGTSLFVMAYLPNSTAPVVQHQPTSTPMAVPTGTRFGLNTDTQEWPQGVIMPSVDIDLALTGAMEVNGSWVVSENGANYALNTAIPNGKSGNTVLYGHDRPQLFRNIHNLKVGDEIQVLANGMVYVYSVTGNEIVKPTDVRIFDQTINSQLTLITCDGWTSADRYIVHAEFTRIEN